MDMVFVYLNGVVTELVDSGQDVLCEVRVGVDLALEGRDPDVTFVDAKRSGTFRSGMLHVVHLKHKRTRLVKTGFKIVTRGILGIDKLKFYPNDIRPTVKISHLSIWMDESIYHLKNALRSVNPFLFF